MLTLRPGQLQAIPDRQAERYVAQATEFARSAFPAWCERRGPDEVNAAIRKAMVDASAFGIERSHDVTGLLTLMVLLGDDFASDPQYAWARDVLSAKTLDPGERIRVVLDELTRG